MFDRATEDRMAAVEEDIRNLPPRARHELMVRVSQSLRRDYYVPWAKAQAARDGTEDEVDALGALDDPPYPLPADLSPGVIPWLDNLRHPAPSSDAARSTM